MLLNATVCALFCVYIVWTCAMSMNSYLLVEGVSETGNGSAMIGTYDSYQASFHTHFLSPILDSGPRTTCPLDSIICLREGGSDMETGTLSECRCSRLAPPRSDRSLQPPSTNILHTLLPCFIPQLLPLLGFPFNPLKGSDKQYVARPNSRGTLPCLVLFVSL